MLFKKKPTNQPRRTRQPVKTGGLGGSRPVFSYHARSGRGEGEAGGRNPRLLWVAGDTPKAPVSRRPAKSLPKRFITVIFGTVALALVVNSLILSRDPGVVTLADTGTRRLLLRNSDSYYEAARTILGGSWTNVTKLTINTDRVAAELQRQFPELEAVSITLPLVGHQPVIYIQPAEPALVFKDTGGDLFIMGPSGMVLGDVSSLSRASKLGLPVVEDRSGLPAEPGRTALPSDNVAFITEVLRQLEAKKIEVTSLVLPQGGSQLDLRIKGARYFVKFSLQGNARAEAGAFLAVKKHLERERKTPSAYIDVRVENKAYYR